MIEVAGLSKTYAMPDGQAVAALRDVSFTARPGTIFGLLGPNGAGKTTTLRIIATTLRPSAGTVRVAGVDALADPLGARRKVGFLSASTGLYDRLSPRETLAYFGRLHGLDGAPLEARIEELVAALDMTSFADRLCGLLSSGQKQKTSVARALLADPPVLVFDEPTASLDVLVARALLERVAALRDARRTIVLSTHILSEVERLCDEVAIIHRGRLLAQGSLAEVQARAGREGLEEAFFALVHAADEEAGGAA